MMKKFKYVIMMAVALALGFSSCSNDDQETPADGVVPNGKATVARITLTQAGPSTYATGDPEAPTASESKVTSAKLLVFNAVGSFEKAVDLGTGTGTTFMQTTTGTHYFYAVVNPTTAINTTINAFTAGVTSLSAAKKAIANVTAISGLTATDNFLMTNTGEATSFNVVAATEAEATAGSKNKIEISVGRAVAKVNVKFNPDAGSFALSSVAYKVHNNPNKMHLMPVIESGQWKTPFYADPTVTKTNYFNNSTWNTAISNAFVPGKASYAMENSNAVVKQGNATYISVKGTHTPTTLVTKDGTTPGTLSGTKDFWRILADNHYDAKYFSEDPSGGSYIGTLTGTVKVVKFAAGECFYRLYLADNSQSDAVAKHTIKRNTSYQVDITSVRTIGGNIDGGGTKDIGGLDVTPVDPENPEERPDKPVAADTWIKASIKVLDWTIVSQSGGI